MTGRHNHHHGKSGTRLFAAILINLGITVAEVIGGLLTGYLALLADAVHNLSDVAALILAYIGERGASAKPTKKSTYGLKRLEVMTAFISAVSLVVIAVYIFYEAYRRFVSPQEISNLTLLLIVAVIGLAGNLLSVWLLHSSREHSLNFKTAFLHMIYDTLSSLAVIIGAIVIVLTGWSYLDPILSVLIGLMILKSSFGVLKEATIIFMEAVPGRIDYDKVSKAIAGHPKVRNIHHLHIWSLSSTSTALSCHISLDKEDFHSSPEVIGSISELMAKQFNIDHCTIQAEMEDCSDDRKITISPDGGC